MNLESGNYLDKISRTYGNLTKIASKTNSSAFGAQAAFAYSLTK